MRQRKRIHRRTGTAVVELAVCLPVMLTLVLGSIECCSMIFLTQSLHIAAYESAREGANADALAGDAQARAQSIFQDRGLNGAKIQFQPANPVALPRGTQFTATATAPTAENGIFALRFFTGSLASSVVMVKE